MATLAAGDPHTHHPLMTDLPPQPKQLVFDTAGIAEMGQRWAAVEIEHYDIEGTGGRGGGVHGCLHISDSTIIDAPGTNAGTAWLLS